MQVTGAKETSQIPAFRRTVERRMADYRRRLADRMRHERERQSLSRESLALRADVSERTIKRIENEEVENPRRVTIRRIAEALEVSPEELRPPEELEADQLNRIEAKLDQLLDYFDIAGLAELADDDGPATAPAPGRTKKQRG